MVTQLASSVIILMLAKFVLNDVPHALNKLRTLRINPEGYMAIRDYAVSTSQGLATVDSVLRHALGIPDLTRKLGPRTYWAGVTGPVATISVSDEVLLAIDSTRHSVETPGKRFAGRVTVPDAIIHILQTSRYKL